MLFFSPPSWLATNYTDIEDSEMKNLGANSDRYADWDQRRRSNGLAGLEGLRSAVRDIQSRAPCRVVLP
jgi:hypothetical protein